MKLLSKLSSLISQEKKAISRTDATIQMEGAECGAASLCTILKFYKCYVPLEELRKAACVSRDGANAKFITEAAREYGLDAQTFKVNKFYLNNIASYPAIGFWGFNHFLVIEGLDDKHAYLSDPAKGRYRVDLAFFYKKFANVLIELKPNKSFEKRGKKRFNLEKVLDIVKPYKLLIGLYVTTVLLSTLPILFVAGAISFFTDEILLSGKFDLALSTFWMIVLATTVACALSLTGVVIDRRITFLMTKDIASRTFQKIQTSPMSFIERRLTGELSGRTSLAIRVPQLIASSLITFFGDLVVAVAVLVVTFFISGTISAFFIITFALNIFLVLKLTVSRLDLNVSYAISKAEANAITLEGISSINVLKACGLEFDFLERWIQKYVLQVNQSQRLLRDVTKSAVASNATSFILTASIYSIGGFLIFFTQNLSIGSLISLQFLVVIISGPFSRLPKVIYAIQNLEGELGRYSDLIDCPDDSKVIPPLIFNKSSLNRAAINPRLRVEQNQEVVIDCKIELLDISQRFTEKSPYILKGLSLDLGNTNHTALVGGSGCGKSTLLKIIAGLTECSGGKVLFNGQLWSPDRTLEIRKMVGYVPQTPSLFNGTIRDNLTLFDPDITDNQIYEIATKMKLDKVIYSHVDRLDYQLSDNGGNLSGGQKQLIEITRALLREPKVLLLDEATAALDPETEESVLETIWSLDCKTISAAHRLLSATMGDLVCFIKDGVVAESGHPDNLLKQSDSLFAQLVKMEG